MSPLRASLDHARGVLPRMAVPGLCVLVAVLVSGCNEDTASKPTAPSSSPAAHTTSVPATDRSATTGDASKPADNTAQNKRDDGSTVTPLDQGMGEADTAITQAIRKAVVAEKDLSINAQNVKIITKDGTVTLRGPVASEAERMSIASKAQQVAGVRAVINNLEVASK